MVYDNPNGLRGGVWDTVSYDPIPDRTLMVAADCNFSADYVNTYIQVNIASASTYPVIDWDDQTATLHFAGDLTSAAAAGNAWYAPDLATTPSQLPANSGAWRAQRSDSSSLLSSRACKRGALLDGAPA